MATIKFDQGNGSTVDPYSSGLTDYSFGQSPNANAMSRAISGFSNFNIPRASPTKIQNIDVASNGSVSAIQTILDRYKTDQVPELFGAPLTGPLAGPLLAAGGAIGTAGSAIGGAVSGAATNFGQFLTSPAPNFPITTDPMGNPVRGLYTDDSEQTGPSLDRYGRVSTDPLPATGATSNGTGTSLNQQLLNAGAQFMNKPETVDAQTMAGVLAGNVTDTPVDFTKTDTDLSIDAQIKQYEDTFEKRKARLSIKMYGAPKVVNNPDDSVSLEYTPAEGRDYFGLSPGQVVGRSIPKPAPGASFEELRRYRDALSTQLRVPQYNTPAFNKIWDDLGIVGIKKFQKDALAAQLYSPTQDSISFGNVSQKDLELMKGLMTDANVNGRTWQEELDSHIMTAKQNPQNNSGGGGGGGGSSVYTQVQYSNTSMAVARSTLTQILQSALGRIPTDSELSEFMVELGKAESQSPTTIVTSTNKVGSKTKAVSRTTPSTVDINDMALSFAKRIGGGGEYDENKAQYYLNLIAKQYGYGFGQG